MSGAKINGKDVFDRLTREVGAGAESLSMTHDEFNALRMHLAQNYPIESAPSAPWSVPPRCVGTFMRVPFTVTR